MLFEGVAQSNSILVTYNALTQISADLTNDPDITLKNLNELRTLLLRPENLYVNIGGHQTTSYRDQLRKTFQSISAASSTPQRPIWSTDVRKKDTSQFFGKVCENV